MVKTMGEQWKVSKATLFQARKVTWISGQVSFFNFATVAFVHFNKGLLGREFERKGFFYLVNLFEETLLLLIDKLVLELLSTGDLQLSIKSERQNIRKTNSMEI